MNRSLYLASLVSVIVTLTGCARAHIPSPADLPIVYKIDVQQGNVITQGMVAQLQPGMEKTKVRFIMGTPLVADVFHQDRWDYVYTMQKRGGQRQQRRVSLYFKDDKLERVEGNVKPASGAIAVTEKKSTTVEVPGQQSTTLVGRLKEKFSSDKESKVADKQPGATTAGTDAAQPVAAAENGKAAEKVSADDKQAQDAAPATGTQSVSEEKASVAAAAPVGDDKAASAKATKEAVAAAGKSSKTTVVVIPDNAPKPPEKGFFRKLLEKVGVGDNEEGDYQSADTKYKDPSNPDNGP